MAINSNRVLEIFLKFPDRRMRAGDVWKLMSENGKHYASDGNISEACASLHRIGKLIRVRQGSFVWYQLDECRRDLKNTLKDKILNVFLEFPDRELRAVEVQKWMNWPSLSRVTAQCIRLYREGKLFRKQEGTLVWYCIAREMR